MAFLPARQLFPVVAQFFGVGVEHTGIAAAVAALAGQWWFRRNGAWIVVGHRSAGGGNQGDALPAMVGLALGRGVCARMLPMRQMNVNIVNRNNNRRRQPGAGR